MAKPARMSDVAKAAGVSSMTVSRVLNRNPNVTEDTRKRVFAAIQDLRYHRNELARSREAAGGAPRRAAPRLLDEEEQDAEAGSESQVPP